jgi:energy-coupling factor transporter ATP-binding protein EcfA2
MRLRYVHFPRCGPLVDVAIVFGQENMLFGWTPEDPARRKGAINFVVGVNGTGKSSLLRAIYQTFRALKNKDLPPLPVTLAWDRFEGEKRVTCLLHHPAKADERPWFAVLNPIDESTHENAAQWQGLVDRLLSIYKQGSLMRNEGKMLYSDVTMESLRHFVGNENSIITPLLDAHLPQRLVAYTSGDQLLWTQAELPKLPIAKADELEEGGDIADDRPPSWSTEREWSEEVLSVMDQIIDRNKSDTSTKERVEKMVDLGDTLPLLNEIHGKRTSNRRTRAESNPNAVFRVRPSSLRVAGISVALWQAATELKGRTAQWQRDELRKQLREMQARTLTGDDARRILCPLDWFWPTHLSFTYRPADLEMSAEQQRQMTCLLALADEVTVQPRGHLRMVVSLGPVKELKLPTRLNEVDPSTPYELPDKKENDTPFDVLVRRVNDSATGAEAILRIFSTSGELDATLVETFESLHKWEDSGLIAGLTLTIKRLNQMPSFDGELDDVVIRYEDLSDGEQMLLGRMALFFLLRRQDGALLLLDEPETHFNDVWKREMIDLVDDAILKTTTAQVIVATHTSIALTDVFSSEIVRFTKPDGVPKVEEVAFPTFGADPGRILLHVFGSPDTIGSRAAEFLRDRLKKEWKSADPVKAAELRGELERLVSEIGSGWPRAKLAEILSKLDDAPPSS